MFLICLICLGRIGIIIPEASKYKQVLQDDLSPGHQKKNNNLILSMNFPLIFFLNTKWAIQRIMQSVFELELISNSNCYFAYSLRGFCPSGARAARPISTKPFICQIKYICVFHVFKCTPTISDSTPGFCANNAVEEETLEYVDSAAKQWFHCCCQVQVVLVNKE